MKDISKHDVTVSVIIPTYNSSGTLRLALQTVLWQDFTDFEIWVIGDGCTDESEKVVAQFTDERLHWVNLPSNSGGPSLPRNEGLCHAKGEYIAYLGHDDLWFPWHLSELVDCMKTRKSDFVYSLGAMLGPNGVIGTFTIPTRPWSTEQACSPSNWLHRKDLIENIGFWSCDFTNKLGDDREFLDRVFSENVTLEFRRQLSVLKFPSWLWQMYSLKTDFPQTRYVQAMRQDAIRLREELLLDIATLMSRKGVILEEYGSPVSRFLGRLIALAMKCYGRRRWPLNRLLYRRWRRSVGLN